MEFFILLFSCLIAPAILLVMQKKIKETHKQVTVNHHSSENPTVLDLLSTLVTETRELRRDFNSHIEEYHRKG